MSIIDEIRSNFITVRPRASDSGCLFYTGNHSWKMLVEAAENGLWLFGSPDEAK
jgi:hypothetical protein